MQPPTPMLLQPIKSPPCWSIGAHNIQFNSQRAENPKGVEREVRNSIPNMKNPNLKRITLSSVPEDLSLCLHSTSYGSSQFKQRKVDLVIEWVSRFSKRADSFAQGVRDHVSLGPKISETVKGKLSLGTRILQAGGIEKVFKRSFSVGKGEKLLKAFQCYLSTSAGPIAGLLFVSSEKIAFRSDRSLTLASPKGDLARIPYKVLIPLGRIKKANPSENSSKPNRKYIQMVTVDGFEFWFMGFLSFQRSFKYLQQAVSEAQARFRQ